ncbi:MAG: YibE/F family protein [Peptoniphilus sp.]|nr:YibE/F family protein [Peptoniphilus sp.]MDD7363603.1 YibE/F family protein [Bacillota bacterium]MDY6045206.1 YibE/F family protein [Peptoniphilus sp.]
MKKFTTACLVLILVGIFFFWKQSTFGDILYNHSTLSFERGTVADITDEHLEEGYDHLLLGNQELVVNMKNPKYKKPLKVTNVLSTQKSVHLEKGDGVIVLVDEPKGVPPYYSVYSPDRTGALIFSTAAFLALIFWVGRRKGLKAVLALAVSFFIIFLFMIPSIYMGANPIFITILTCILCSIYAFLILYGWSLMSAVNLISVSIAFIASALIFLFLSRLLHLTGYNLSDAESLLLISKETGMKIHSLLFAGVAIAAYGASKDVSVSISSSLFEISNLHPESDRRELFASGMRIGKDILGTMVDTLLFAFLGSSLTTVLVFIAAGVEPMQLLNSDYFAVEFITSIVSTMVLVLLVPISSYISALFFKEKERLQKNRRA